jgi:hypothetical protein
MKILTVISPGEYGKRHLENIQIHKPPSWEIKCWQAPVNFPLIIDYPEDHLPDTFDSADLILSFAENKSVAELIPDIVQMTGARGVIVAVDNETWLPRGLARQLVGWLDRMGVPCVTPKPLCSLTETDYKITRRERISYKNPEISEFARYFGQPDFEIQVDPNTKEISYVEVNRDAVCGCARFVAEGLIGLSVDDAEENAGLRHHHFPCLASMMKLVDYNHDTLMHESGNLLKENIGEQIKPYKKTRYIQPGKISK